MGDIARRVRSHRYAQTPERLLDDPRVSDRGVRLWGMLDRYADGPMGAVPGRARLAERLRCHPATIWRTVGELAAAGWIEVHHRAVVDGRVVYVEHGELVTRDAKGRITASAVGVRHMSIEYVVYDEPIGGQASPETDAEALTEPEPQATPEAVPPITHAPTSAHWYTDVGSPVIRDRSGSSEPDEHALSRAAESYDKSGPEPFPAHAEALTPEQRAVIGRVQAWIAVERGDAPPAVVRAGSAGESWARAGVTLRDLERVEVEAGRRDAGLAYMLGILERVARDREEGRDPWPASKPHRPPGGGSPKPPDLQPERANVPPPPPSLPTSPRLPWADPPGYDVRPAASTPWLAPIEPPEDGGAR